MSTTFEIAHIREQGVDLIIVFLASVFGTLPAAEQQQTILQLTACARGAGLAGTVIPVWPAGSQWRFIAPQEMHPFFTTVDFGLLAASINKKLTCG